MLAPPRIALISAMETGLWSDLAALPCSPELRRFRDLVSDAEDLRRFAPRLVVLRKDRLTAEDLGSWHLIRTLVPQAAALVVVDSAQVANANALATPDSVTVLGEPMRAGELALAVDRALSPAPTGGLDLLLELARAIGDEINNPLLFVSGHIRLLRESIDKERQKDLHARILGVAENVQRIEATMAKLRTLVRAAAAPRTKERRPLAAIARDALASEGNAPKGPVDLVVPDELAQVCVTGDTVLLRAAVLHFVTACRELARDPGPLVLVLGPAERGLRLRVDLHPRELVSWELPRDTEPWSLMRAVRGSAAQLSLLVVQSIAIAHGGAATLLRRPDERIVVELVLPAG